ncbi:TetR/AcrR family transcriptional regulator [Rhizobium alvei]|uniref:Helix-turn-helix domain-containing protein n=1 Tax=Rhizobium alvei TaxID=1132659 RepID=A0ABT8YJ78_9HYPH|nr:TetR/AcrR family transcriptional regulator [Rhizobium alvei]MDO6963339.1 helix-turn-helix domain-containing protein [Rhizobium alvei]
MGERMSAKDRLLAAAAELFYRDGVVATGIDAITAHAGVAKMSLYNNFSSKAELVNAYMTKRVVDWREGCDARVAAAKTPHDKVLAVFDSYIEHAGLAYDWGFRGCGLLNAAAELAVDDPARKIVAQQKTEAEERMRSHLFEMRPDGNEEMIGAVAEHLSFLLEGAMARAGLEGHDGRLRAARKLAVSILESL